MDIIIEDRINAISQGPSTEHYSKTEIGILPCNWRVAKLSDIAEKVTQTAGTNSYETVSISAGIGFVNQAKKFGKELSGKQYEKYNVLRKGDFSYNKGNSGKYPHGCIYRLKDRETVAVPNVFESFRILSECAGFYDHLFVSGFLNRQLAKRINHGVRDDGLLNLTEKDFYSCLLPVPPLVEQKKISEILDHCDKLIKLCEAKINEYKALKKTCLSKMFPQNGSTAPELRFPEFTDAWEQRKVGEFYDFKNGLNKGKSFFGSGTPIVNFTDVFHKRGLHTSDLRGKVTLSANEISNYEVRQGDIFFTRTSETIEEIGYPSVMLDAPKSTVFSGFVLRGRAINTDPLTNLFKQYVFFTSAFRMEMIEKSSMTTRALTSGTAIKQMEFQFPHDKDEQDRIGAFFSNLDHLITLHQREGEEYTRLKKAMTQLLLTGIVRVNV